MIITEFCQYEKVKILSCISKANLTPPLLIYILMLVSKLDRQIWTYQAVTYMCQYISKIEDQCSQTMKQEVRENIKNNIHHRDTIKTIAKAYLSNRECSVRETVFLIFVELKLKRIFPAVYFANINLSEKRSQVLLSEKKTSGTTR